MAILLQTLKALSDATRLRLIRVLMRYELSVNELVTILEMGQSRVSRHLKILAEANLVRSRRDGLWVFYTARQEQHNNALLKTLEPFFTVDDIAQKDMTMAASILEDRAVKTRQFFNNIADHWDSLSHEILGGFDLGTAVLEAMPKPCKVAADLGCGTGTVLERLRPNVELLIGVDASPRMLELSRRRFAEHADTVSLRIGDLDHLPLRNEEVDFACINMVMHHVSSPEKALLEVYRSLKPQGSLIITDFDKHNNERMRTDYGDHWLGFATDTMADLLTASGFVVSQTKLHPVEQGLSLAITCAIKP